MYENVITKSADGKFVLSQSASQNPQAAMRKLYKLEKEEARRVRVASHNNCKDLMRSLKDKTGIPYTAVFKMCGIPHRVGNVFSNSTHLSDAEITAISSKAAQLMGMVQ